MKSEKIKAYFPFVLLAIILLSFIAYFLNLGKIDFSEMGLMVVALLIMATAGYYFWDRFKSVKAGLTAEDEFSKKVMYKAGYYSFMGTIWAALLIGMFEIEIAGFFGFDKLEVHNVTGMVILVSAVIFFAAFFYLKSKGDVQ